MRRAPEGGARILLLGYIVGYPLGGMTWHTLHYVLGLARLGHDVWMVEDSDDWPHLYDPVARSEVDYPDRGLAYVADVFERYGLDGRWAYHHAPDGRWAGSDAAVAAATAGDADVVINLSGIHPLRRWWEATPIRLFVDTDPVFTQVRMLDEPSFAAHAGSHTAFATFGECIPEGRSLVPDTGTDWRPTRQPVCLDHWPPAPGPPEGAPWRTVMNWETYPPRVHAGVRYGSKSDSFAPFLDLPGQAGGEVRLEVASGQVDPARAALEPHGWTVVDGQTVAADPAAYRDFVTGASGEWSVAKDGYVRGRSGWFSERSAGFLAAGRPVVVQDTGFSEVLPTGAGLLAFTTAEEAVGALAAVRSSYRRHCDAARQVAEAWFDSDTVLGRLLADAR
ncbi:MAG TPA: hypothetical protein VFH45_07310 [Acidimicrobiales bacterium]|nr:hypothetical protein [Acidimicrobiales bacterium]